MKELTIRTKKKSEFIDITQDVRAYVSHSKVQDGLCLVYVPHTTAGLTVNENADPHVKGDILNYLSTYIPRDGDYKHMEGNSDGHIKSSLMGVSQTFFIENGQILLGTWQGIYFCEFDGPRNRTVFIKVKGC